MTGSDHAQSPGLRYHVTNCRDNRVTTGNGKVRCKTRNGMERGMEHEVLAPA